jgi:hypothetical protein
MATQKKDPRAATCRNAGAVGKNPLVYQAFRKYFTPEQVNAGLAVLDFGAGKDCVHTQKLRLEGYANVWATDLPENMPSRPHGLNGWVYTHQEAWNVVLLSNVLNVQSGRFGIVELLRTVGQHMHSDSATLIFNYPKEPRKSLVTPAALKKIVVTVFQPRSFSGCWHCKCTVCCCYFVIWIYRI